MQNNAIDKNNILKFYFDFKGTGYEVEYLVLFLAKYLYVKFYR